MIYYVLDLRCEKILEDLLLTLPTGKTGLQPFVLLTNVKQHHVK